MQDHPFSRRPVEELLAENYRILRDSGLSALLRYPEGDPLLSEDLEVRDSLDLLFARPDIEDIRSNLLSLPTSRLRKDYLMRIMYETCQELPDGDTRGALAGSLHMSDSKSLRFYTVLGHLGLQTICPYLGLHNANPSTDQDCRIDPKETVMTYCRGEYDTCDLFRTHLARAQFGAPISEPQYPIIFAEGECRVDLHDLSDWWKEERKYA